MRVDLRAGGALVSVLAATLSLLDQQRDTGAPLDATDRYGNTALHGAGRCGRAEAFKLLLARGADAEQLNERGRPPKLLEGDAEACVVQ